MQTALPGSDVRNGTSACEGNIEGEGKGEGEGEGKGEGEGEGEGKGEGEGEGEGESKGDGMCEAIVWLCRHRSVAGLQAAWMHVCAGPAPEATAEAGVGYRTASLAACVV